MPSLMWHVHKQWYKHIKISSIIMWFVLKIWVWSVLDTLKLSQVHICMATLRVLYMSHCHTTQLIKLDRIEIAMNQYYEPTVCGWNTVISTPLNQIVYHQKKQIYSTY
jgi:hypothetical protein